MRARPGPRFLLLLTLVAVAATTPSSLAQEADRARMDVILADPAVGGASGRTAALDVTVSADLVVEVDDKGTFIRMVVPHAHDSAVQLAPLELEFFAPDEGATNGDYGTETLEHNQTYAVFRWTRDAPAAGSNVSATLDATRTVDLTDTVIIIWASHGFDNVTMRVDLPSTHDLVGSRLTKQAHNVPAGRSIWSGSSTDPSASVTINTNSPIADGAFETYRPNPLAGWLIVIGLGVVSGGAWVLGKRMETPEDDASDGDADVKRGDRS